MTGPGWNDGAWERLRRWHERGSGDGGAALDALNDVGAVRRWLDQVELTAVRAARGRGRSWAEIATRLGVTRQSAWERWRDLDDEPRRPSDDPTRSVPTGDDLPGDDLIGDDLPGDDLVGGLLDGPGGRSSRRSRAGLVVVPDVVGLEWDTARRVLVSAELIALSADLDGPPLPARARSGDVVTDQKPAAGERRPRGSSVTVWLGRGPGSAGVREPLHPRPSPRSTGGAVDEQTGEPVP